jgi:hypothetical protein
MTIKNKLSYEVSETSFYIMSLWFRSYVWFETWTNEYVSSTRQTRDVKGQSNLEPKKQTRTKSSTLGIKPRSSLGYPWIKLESGSRCLGLSQV